MYYDLLSQLKNAGRARKESILMPFSKFDFSVAKVLEDARYIESASKKMVGKKDMLEIRLRYKNDTSAISDFKIVSKPSRRLYAKRGEIRLVRQGYGAVILSTSRGVMTGLGSRKENVGGEYLFEIW